MLGYPIQYASTFAVLAIISAMSAMQIRSWPARVGLAYAALVFVVVGVAYLAGSPRLFMKSPAGRRPALSRLLLWPFDLLNLSIFNIYHHISRQPAYVEVAPGLLLGRRLWNREAAALGPCAILDLTCELDENRVMRASPRYRCLPVLDNTAPTQQQLREGVQWLAETLKTSPVYVHCAAGHGRSATMVLAYLLITRQAKSVDQGIAFLKDRRPGVRLNAGQRNAVERFMADQRDARPA